MRRRADRRGSDEAEAVQFALDFAQPGDLVVYFADEIERAAKLLEHHRSSRASLASNPIA
ncbi:MAG TPA: hypothetical protein VIL97_02700 [Thermoanaerobaculia bacterium]